MSKDDDEHVDEPRESASGETSDAPDQTAPEEARPLPNDAAARTDFAKNYPKDPALAKLLAAFDRGDYLTVRRDAEGVAEAAKSPAVAKAARDLRQRIDPATTASFLLLVGLALAVFVGGYFLLQHEHRASPSPPTPQAPSARP